MAYHYYLAKSGITHGPDTEILEKLRVEYERVSKEAKPGHYDGASLMPDGRVIAIVGCHGAGTGTIQELGKDGG